MKVRAAVQVAPRRIEIRAFDLGGLPERGALLRVEACGLCGSDLDSYRGETVAAGLVAFPFVPGHEPVGRIEWIDPESAESWGVGEGDRVAVEPLVTCGACTRCTEGDLRSCSHRFIYSCTPLGVVPGLWGGFAERMVLRPGSIVHRVEDDLSSEDAVLFNPLGAGFEWVCRLADTQVGDAVLILGPGQRGLACVVAAAEAGAETIIVTGLTRDRHKLELARELGATHTIDAEAENVVARVAEITQGRLVDRAIDVTPDAVEPIAAAVEAVRSAGCVVLAGLKGGREVRGPLPDRIVSKELTVRGAIGVSSWAFRQALRVLASRRYPLARLHTHCFPLDRIEHALAALESGEGTVHVTVVP